MGAPAALANCPPIWARYERPAAVDEVLATDPSGEDPHHASKHYPPEFTPLSLQRLPLKGIPVCRRGGG
jgi:hypothetical protein